MDDHYISELCNHLNYCKYGWHVNWSNLGDALFNHTIEVTSEGILFTLPPSIDLEPDVPSPGAALDGKLFPAKIAQELEKYVPGRNLQDIPASYSPDPMKAPEDVIQQLTDNAIGIRRCYKKVFRRLGRAFWPVNPVVDGSSVFLPKQVPDNDPEYLLDIPPPQHVVGLETCESLKREALKEEQKMRRRSDRIHNIMDHSDKKNLTKSLSLEDEPTEKKIFRGSSLPTTFNEVGLSTGQELIDFKNKMQNMTGWNKGNKISEHDTLSISAISDF